MADETGTETNDGNDGGEQGGEPKPRTGKTPKIEAEGGQDPMMARLVAAERSTEAAKREAESLRAKVAKHERESRKNAVIGALYSEFPGIPAAEVKGAALVAADEGVVDLFAEDPKAAVEKLKDILAAKVKETGTRHTPSLGGTPGTAGKSPAATPRFLI